MKFQMQKILLKHSSPFKIIYKIYFNYELMNITHCIETDSLRILWGQKNILKLKQTILYEKPKEY